MLQRLLVLAAVTLIASVGAIALAADRGETRPRNLPEAVPAPGGGWYDAVAGPVADRVYDERTSCGYQLSLQAIGLAHAVLPCGTKVYVRRSDTVVLAQVVAREPGSAEQEFGLTRALGRTLDLRRRGRIEWRFARARR